MVSIGLFPNSLSDGEKNPKYLGNGSARIVYDYSKTRVLKLALSEDDCEWQDERNPISQNKKEIEIFNTTKRNKHLAKIYRYDKNFRWLIAEKVNVFETEKQFIKYTGVDLNDFVNCIYKDIRYMSVSLLKNKKKKKIINKTINSLGTLIKKAELDSADLEEIYHWGTRKNGDIVLVDYGY